MHKYHKLFKQTSIQGSDENRRRKLTATKNHKHNIQKHERIKKNKKTQLMQMKRVSLECFSTLQNSQAFGQEKTKLNKELNTLDCKSSSIYKSQVFLLACRSLLGLKTIFRAKFDQNCIQSCFFKYERIIGSTNNTFRSLKALEP